MGKYFSDVVEKALKDIYYDVTTGRGKESFQLLEKASAEGDGDATCILARCLYGYQYVWRGHDFPEDCDRAEALMHKSVEQGSAIGVLLALRSGQLTPELKAKMPFSSLEEVFQIVLRKAESGEPFCQYTIGNVYFWWDFLEIQGKKFSDEKAFKENLMENVPKCEDWFWKAFRGGLYYAGNNLNQYYEKGDGDIIPPHPEKAEGIWRIGAELGYPIHQYIYGKELDKAGKKEEALRWHKRAAEGGEAGSWYYIGLAYEEGKIVPKDCHYAAQCYEKGLKPSGGPGCFNRLGAFYFDGNGVPQNYEKAVSLLETAYGMENNWGCTYLGKAYFYGLGTFQDYRKAREFLEKINWTDADVYYMLGVIYAQGKGAAQDIKKGVEYLKKAGNHSKAKEELAKYKKTLFGKWVLR